MIDTSWSNIGILIGAILASAAATWKGKSVIEERKNGVTPSIGLKDMTVTCPNHNEIKTGLQDIKKTLQGDITNIQSQGLIAIVQNQGKSILSMDQSLKEIAVKIDAVRKHQINGGSKG